MLFVDTNILLYAISNHQSEAEKNQKARAILGGSDLVFSV